MRGLVSQESDLCEEDAECSGGEQLEPAVAEKDEAGDASAERQHERAEEAHVEDATALQQPLLANRREKRRVGARGVDAVRVTTRCRTHRSQGGAVRHSWPSQVDFDFSAAGVSVCSQMLDAIPPACRSPENRVAVANRLRHRDKSDMKCDCPSAPSCTSVAVEVVVLRRMCRQ